MSHDRLVLPLPPGLPISEDDGTLSVLLSSGALEKSTVATTAAPPNNRKRKQPPDRTEYALNVTKALELCSRATDAPPPRRHAARALHALLCSMRHGVAGEATHVAAAVHGDGNGSGSGDEPDADDNDELDAKIIYSKLHAHVASRPRRPSAPLPPLPTLKPSLRRYQQDAVEWMLAREGLVPSAVPPSSELFWQPLPFADGGTGLLWNVVNGSLVEAGDAASLATGRVDHPLLGGILADEMGLGKSVEVLALVLAHPAPATFLTHPPLVDGGHVEEGRRGGVRGMQCAAGHPLLQEVGGPPVTCDGCGAAVAGGADERFSCVQCDFDLCALRAVRRRPTGARCGRRAAEPRDTCRASVRACPPSLTASMCAARAAAAGCTRLRGLRRAGGGGGGGRLSLRHLRVSRASARHARRRDAARLPRRDPRPVERRGGAAHAAGLAPCSHLPRRARGDP